MEKPCSAAILKILLKPVMSEQSCSARRSQPHLALVHCLTWESEAGLDHLSRWEAPLTSLLERAQGLKNSAVCLQVNKEVRSEGMNSWKEQMLKYITNKATSSSLWTYNAARRTAGGSQYYLKWLPSREERISCFQGGQRSPSPSPTKAKGIN